MESSGERRKNLRENSSVTFQNNGEEKNNAFCLKSCCISKLGNKVSGHRLTYFTFPVKTHQNLLDIQTFETLILCILIGICLIVITRETPSVLGSGQGLSRDPPQPELWVALVSAKSWHWNEVLLLLYFQLLLLVTSPA